ncbi:MAG: hypothetical protein A3E78_10135 [Alphaproteobacteria bacterium RIFCSPHIGHO2_12_FULL_63_12]|nr:MAG: hypothetical protein A3E78_10135 [Alphaproteobacteria bacterium RIFCSPHIGHO2_12_FULL_63_12]
MAYAFNNDIFLSEADRETAMRAFPNVAYALDNAALRKVFEVHDIRANQSKTRSRRWGVIAVLLATLALMTAASSTLYAGAPAHIQRAISIAAAFCGIASVAIGFFGVMFRGRKLRWLTDRLATERLRQFHFQHYAAHGGAILKGARDEAARAAYIELRDRDFERFRIDFLERLDDEFFAIVEAEDPDSGLLFDFSADLPDTDDPHLEEYYRAYELLRFQRQIDYCNLLLSDSRNLWKHAPARQARFFGGLGLTCLAVVLSLDSLVFMGSIAGLPFLAAPIFSVAGVLVAFFALGARTIEDGLQPGVEAERMRQYRIALNRSHARYRGAKTPDDRIEPMIDLENASFEEMIPFLKTNFAATFVM